MTTSPATINPIVSILWELDFSSEVDISSSEKLIVLAGVVSNIKFELWENEFDDEKEFVDSNSFDLENSDENVNVNELVKGEDLEKTWELVKEKDSLNVMEFENFEVASKPSLWVKYWDLENATDSEKEIDFVNEIDL